ncbi:site-specific DNA-methyltransferase, partial [bacterium]|nr:site-specific DNA-methyltransferase [bacterium]
MSSHLNINQACDWASKHLNKNVSKSNLSYLIQYGRIKNLGDNGTIIIDRDELKEYYKWSNGNKEKSWKKKLGDDLNWDLSFDNLNEKDTTKHVHRLHPYKGKFIPQLVEYFLDNHIDDFKKEVFFKKGNTILDPFCGSGTTLVQSNELGIHSIGIDVSAFNVQISNAKVGKYDLREIQKTAQYISKQLRSFLSTRKNIEFERKLLAELKGFNDKNFPSPEFKYKVRRKDVNEKVYGAEKETEFLPVYNNLIKEYGI